MAARVACEIIVEVGMGIEVKDRHRAMDCVNAAHHRMTHRVVAAQNQWNGA